MNLSSNRYDPDSDAQILQPALDIGTSDLGDLMLAKNVDR